MSSRLQSIARVIPLVSAIVYVILFVLGFLILRPTFLWNAADVNEFFDSYGKVLAGAWVLGLSTVGLVWFLGSLASALRAVGERRLGIVAFGGGVAGAAATVMGSVMFSMGALRVDDVGGIGGMGPSGGIGPGYTVGVFDLAMILIFAAAPFMFGVTVAATAVGIARAEVAEKWEIWISVLLAVALWIPVIAWIAVWVFLAWVVWVGWKIYAAVNTDSGGSGPAGMQGLTSTVPAGGPFGPGSHDVLADGSMPAGYPIKGNIDSMLYHRPDSRNYAATGAEVWFDTAESAEAAGFAKAKTHPDD